MEIGRAGTQPILKNFVLPAGGHSGPSEIEVHVVAGLEGDGAILLNQAIALAPGDADDVAVLNALNKRGRDELACGAGLDRRLAIEPDPGIRRHLHVELRGGHWRGSHGIAWADALNEPTRTASAAAIRIVRPTLLGQGRPGRQRDAE